MASILFAFDGIVMLVTIVMHASLVRGALSRFESYSPRCDSQSCIQRYTRTAYSNLFQSATDLQDLKATFQAARTQTLKEQGYTSEVKVWHDGDSCCATQLVFTSPHSLVDLFGNPRHIVHDPTITDYEAGVTNENPTTHQYIPSAKCVRKGGSCRGKCFKEPICMQILVYDSSSPSNMTFAWFAVPGYCSCKNVSGWFWGG